ncbi:GAF domain-containing protein [Streptomyces sp. enrichment culture]|uniref:GAF domain-containing protein n=1 Tax=Streptomyces sp. enrichment culture TaxID=1795815 RepID=UPI003F54FA13
MDVTRLAAVDTTRAARVLSEVRSAALAGQRAPVAPRPVIGQSWERMLRRGVDPDRDVRSGLLSRAEVQRRRESSRLRHVLPVLREGLLSVADVAHHIMVVADEEGRVLWREGSAPVLRKADGLGFEIGADWREDVVGTNGVGTPAVTRQPVQVFASEHFVRSHAAWTCAGAPLTDPRDGRLIGVVDVSGPLETMHPATLAWVDSVAKLAEARLREMHLESLERLRAVAAPVLARTSGRALVVDRHGWTAAVTGMPYTRRLALPEPVSAGMRWLPALGRCSLEPLAGGWLVRAADEPVARDATRIVLDLRGPRRWSVEVSGDAGSWTRELSPRHAELLYLLAVHRAGRSAAGLAQDVFGDPARTVTVRAEMSRVRRYLGSLLDHRPYRFAENAEVDVLLPDDPRDLLPHSTAPALSGRRTGAAEP